MFHVFFCSHTNTVSNRHRCCFDSVLIEFILSTICFDCDRFDLFSCFNTFEWSKCLDTSNRRNCFSNKISYQLRWFHYRCWCILCVHRCDWFVCSNSSPDYFHQSTLFLFQFIMIFDCVQIICVKFKLRSQLL